MYSPSSDSEDDEGSHCYRRGGYHAVRIGDRFAAGGRYVVQRKLGWGHYSTVWLAYDTLFHRYVALKIQKSAREYAHAALHEIEILLAVADGDPTNSKCVVRLLDHFKHAGPNGQHYCLVFEFLGDNLLRLIRYNHNKGIGLNKVKYICRSVLLGLDYLHRELGIIHTDLKPENVLLVSTIDPSKDPANSIFPPILERPEGNSFAAHNLRRRKLRIKSRKDLFKIPNKRESMGGFVEVERSLDGIDLRCKVVDLGNACWFDRQSTGEIQTRQYRAPEVILGYEFSFPADMWSFACLAFELATGDTLFTPNSGKGFTEDEGHLAQMIELLGKLPKKFATEGSKSKNFLDRFGELKRIRRIKFWPLDRVLKEKYKFSEFDARSFAEFLSPLLNFEPEMRPTAAQCLQHSWLQD